MITKPFLVNNNGIKVDKENYCQHLRRELFLAIEKVIKCDDWTFAQDEMPTLQSRVVQDLLKTRLKRHFILKKIDLHSHIGTLLRPKFTKEDLESRLHQKLRKAITICPTNESCRRKTRKVYQNAV